MLTVAVSKSLVVGQSVLTSGLETPHRPGAERAQHYSIPCGPDGTFAALPLTVGQSIRVYFDANKAWFAGTITSTTPEDHGMAVEGGGFAQITYGGGEEMHHDLNSDDWKGKWHRLLDTDMDEGDELSTFAAHSDGSFSKMVTQ